MAKDTKLDLPDFESLPDFEALPGEELPTPQSESSTLRDFLISGTQGLSIGAGDEIVAGIKSAGDVVTGRSKLEDLYEQYRKHQAEQQAIVDAAVENSPMASLAGNLIGGAIPALATMGASTPASAAGAGMSMAELGALPWKQLLSRIGASGLKGAKTGAMLAAPAAFAASDKTIEQPMDLLKETASGAALGGVLGGGLSALGTGLKGVAGKLSNAADNFDVARQAKLSYQHGKAGFDIKPSDEFFNVAQSQQRNDITRLTNTFLGGEEQLTDELYDSLREASRQGQKVSVDPQIVSMLSTTSEENPGLIDLIGQMKPRIGNQRAEQLMANLAKIQSGEVDPLTAWNTRKALYELMDEVPEVKGMIKGINESLKGSIEEAVPGVAQTAHELQEFVGAGKESLLEGGASAKFSERGASDVYNADKRFSQEIKGILESITNSRSDMDKQRKFGELMDRIKSLDPMLLRKLKIDPNELERDFKRSGDLFTIAKKLGGSELGASPFGDFMSVISGGAVPTLRGGVYEAASLGGRTANLSKRVFDLGRDQLTNVAKELQNLPETAYLGKALEKGLMDPSGSSKNSILFILMQRPDTRKIMEGLFGE